MIPYIAAEQPVKTRSFHITADYIRVNRLTFQADACHSTWVTVSS
jgi:hypothetical protein